MTRKFNTLSRTAAFAWSPGNQSPMVATGTMAGAVDDFFTNASDLEIFKLDLFRESKNVEPTSKVSTLSRFNTLAWGHATAEKPYGIIAGGMESGELELWDPSAILSGKSSEEALISRNSTHKGTLKAIDFNYLQTNLLASAGSHSEVYTWDLNNPTTPYTPGARSTKMDDISSVAWNCQVQHILSTASTNGYTVVWDLRNKKEVMTLAHSGQSALTSGGRGSISSIAWHPNVATQIVTASDDDQNPIVSLWDLRHAHSPEKILTGHSKGVLDVSWCRQDSDLLISSAKDCKTLCWNPNTGVLNGELSSNHKWTFQVDWCPHHPGLLATSSFDGAINLFSMQGSQQKSALDSDNSPFELTTPPKWLRRPVGASFGFSGKLVTFNSKATTTRTVKIINVETDPEIVKRSEQLESASKLGIEQLIQDRIQTSDKKDWESLKALFSDNARQELIKYLGFEKEQVMTAAQDLLNKSQGTMSSLFGTSSPDESFFGQVAVNEKTTNSPFNLYPQQSSDTDHLITRAIILGDFESAVNICLATQRYSDALLFAVCGGSELLTKTQNIYFEKQSKKFTYLRLLEGILKEDLSSIVRDADLNEWSSVLVVLCTFAQSKDFAPLCEILGDRLAKDTEMSQHATLFYLVAGNLEKVSTIWINQFNKEDAQQGDNSTYGSRLHALIEKVTIFRQAIDFEDIALHDNSEIQGDYPLASLYDKYCEYAEFMATQGKLDVALKYISLTPAANPKSKISRGSIVRDRVYHANTSQSGQYVEPVFPFEKKQLSSKQQIYQPVILQNPKNQKCNVYQDQHVSAVQPPADYYAPTNVALAQYSPYGQPNCNLTLPGSYNSQPQCVQVTQQNYSPTTTHNPPKATGAWNDPPMLPSPKGHPQYTLADNMPTKRVTTPFAGSPTTDSPQQQQPVPPAMRGLGGPPPPPSSGTTVGYYSAHQQLQQFQPSHQLMKATPPPPPPMNAVAPLPMRRGPPSPQHQQKF